MPQRIRLAVGAVAVGLVAITGCSSSGSSPTNSPSPTATAVDGTAYSLALNAIKVAEDQADEAAAAVYSAKTVTKVRAVLTAFADAQVLVAQRLGAINPPTDAASVHIQYISALNGNAAAIRALVARLATANTAREAIRIARHNEGLSQSSAKVAAALKRLKDLGYA